MTNKHPKAEIGKNTPRDDLRDNPDIGQSKGLGKAGDVGPIEGESTVEGDVANDTNAQGGVREDQLGRRNK